MIKRIISIFNIIIIMIFLSCETNPSISNCVEDLCGVCDSDPSNDCIEDCNGIPNGNAFEDCSGVCGGKSIYDCANNCITGDNNGNYNGDFSNMDCSGVCNGAAILDNCGICSEGDTGINPDTNLECGCYGLPQLAKEGEAENAGFVILGIDDNYFLNNGCSNEIISYSPPGSEITTPCGMLTDLKITNTIYSVQNIIFYEKITDTYSIPHEFSYYEKSCVEDDLDISDACNLLNQSGEGYSGTIYINQSGEVLYNSSISIKNFKFNLEQESCIERSTECNFGTQDFTDGICEGPLYDSDLDGVSESNCECFKELDTNQIYPCCCGQTRDCKNLCGGTAVLDVCNICDGDGTSCIGCDGELNSGLEFDCAGICGGNAIDEDNDDICDDIDNCIGTAEECQEAISGPCDLPVDECSDNKCGTLFLDPNDNGTVWYNVNFNFAGFQWDVDGSSVTASNGGDAASWNVAANGGPTLIGFDFSGGSIQAGCGVLTNMSLTGQANSLSNIYFTDDAFGPANNVIYFIND